MPSAKRRCAAKKQVVGLAPIACPSGREKAGIGHEASSGAIFRVELAHDMVTAVTRDQPGPNYVMFSRVFLDTVYSTLAL